MSQCKAMFYPPGRIVGFYCVLDEGHKGAHVTYERKVFTEAQAKRYKTTHPAKRRTKPD